MNSKTLRNLFVLVVLLLLGWFGLRGRNTRDLEPPVGAWSLSRLTDKTVDHVEIREKTESVVLKMNNGQWVVGVDKVDPIKFQQLWDALARVVISGPLSRNAQNQDQFDVDAASARRVTMSNEGNVIETLFIGKPGNDLDTSYVRRGSEDATFLATPSLRSVFMITSSDWKLVEPVSSTDAVVAPLKKDTPPQQKKK